MRRLAAIAAALALAAGCSGEESADAPADPGPVEVERIPPYAYPAPVSGGLSEANVGTFDLVDGLAYPHPGGKGTVVFVTSKPIASPLLAATSCPVTKARALTMLRDARYAEVTLDADGNSPSYIYGESYGARGRGIDVGSREWGGSIEVVEGVATGAVKHRSYGKFSYALALARPLPTEVSEDDRFEAGHAAWGGDAPVPAEADTSAAYARYRQAALDGDLGAYLAAMGFDRGEAEKIRGLAGIADDFRAHRDRFLDPGAPEEPMLEAGFAQVGARGTNSKGEAFANYYELTPCGGKLVLTGIYLNPQ